MTRRTDFTITGAMEELTILLTNDDGIASPGLHAAAAALTGLGRVVIVAPKEQKTSAGRSLDPSSDYRLTPHQIVVNGDELPAYSVKGSPAQAVRCGVLDLLPEKPDLLVSGINYGENVGSCVTTSGTVGAAIEAAALGIPSMAVSLETDPQENFSHSVAINFSVAAHFTRLVAGMMIGAGQIPDVDLLKVEVPADASRDTPWTVTRVSRQAYYEPASPQQLRNSNGSSLFYRIAFNAKTLEADSDIHALRLRRFVSVSPLSIDMTSRVDLRSLEAKLRDRF